MKSERLDLQRPLNILAVLLGLLGPAVCASAQAAKPQILAVVNAASFEAVVGSASWISIFGTNLSPLLRSWQESDFSGNRLPRALDGDSVLINGSLGYVSYISPTQINVLTPDEPVEGLIAVRVSTSRGISEPFPVTKERLAPALFGFDAERCRSVAAVHLDGTVAAKPGLFNAVTSWPASPRDTVVLFGNGLGATDPPLLASQIIPAPAPLTSPVSAWIAGLPLGVTSAALVQSGLYQVQVTIPQIPDGEHPIVLQAGAFRTQNQGLLSVRSGLVADHTSTDLSRIPDVWLERARQNVRLYFAHTSHGSQITSGLQRLESQLGGRYRTALGASLPSVAGALNILDNGSVYDWDPDFLSSIDRVLAANRGVNAVMYMWCGQPARPDWQTLFNEYVSGMQALEERYPRVTFIYATGNAQEQDCAGCWRQKFNQELRKYARQRGKVLFDFGDLDAWYSGRQSSYAAPNWCSTHGCSPRAAVPSEHPQWGGGDYNNPCGHASYPSCDNKAKAMWWLLARIAGWDGVFSGSVGA